MPDLVVERRGDVTVARVVGPDERVPEDSKHVQVTCEKCKLYERIGLPKESKRWEAEVVAMGQAMARSGCCQAPMLVELRGFSNDD